MTTTTARTVAPTIRHRLLAPPLWVFPSEKAAFEYANQPGSPVQRCGSWFTWQPRRRKNQHLSGCYALTSAGRVVMVWPHGDTCGRYRGAWWRKGRRG